MTTPSLRTRLTFILAVRELGGEVGAQALQPLLQRRLRRVVEPHDLFRAQLLGELHGRELRAVQDLVGVRVADAAEEPRVGERSLECVTLRLQSLDELIALFPESEQVEPEEMRTALRLLQSFDPPGVGARDTAECLRLQLDTRHATDRACPGLTLARQIVSEYLPMLAARDFLKLKKVLGCSEEELRLAHQLIRTLSPRPGVAFGDTRADYVVPDVFVRRIRGRWTAVLNNEVMPRLRVNQAYADILKRGRGDRTVDPAQRGQWTTRVQEARWLIRNIQQRFDTIRRVSQAIVDRQHNFFTHGEIAMRPLVLREIADTVGLHESTISRVTANKYMATPFGIFELKFFFGSHVATEAGGEASSTAIRALIKQLIGAEDTRNPLSDSKLAEMLGEQGIVVARRTVAKYREALRIPPVAMRKSL